MKLSDRLKREHAYVESQLGDRIICDRCKTNLSGFHLLCTADLGDSCDGYFAIESAKYRFNQMELERLKRL